VDASQVVIAAFVLGTVGNAAKAVPQFLRTAVRGQVAGLSTTAVWLALVANVLWLCFGLAIRDWAFVALGLVQTALTAGTLGRFLARTGWRSSRRHALVALGACAAFGVLAATRTGAVLESLGAALGVLIGAPQLLHLWRRRRTPTDVSGVSPAEPVVVVAAQVAWTAYWLLQGHPVAAAGAAWGAAARAATLVLLRRQLARRDDEPDRRVLRAHP
jgi:uncharacterized protein with PQ loop repeat